MDIDQVLKAIQQGQTPPPDGRAWVLVEIADGQRTWTTHGLALEGAFLHLMLAALDLRDQLKGR